MNAYRYMSRRCQRKVAIIGSGYVGSSIAYALTIRNLTQRIVLIDVNNAKAEGEALDIQHGIPFMGVSAVVAGGYEDVRDCDLIIITAGRNRKPGESRLELLRDNAMILRNVVDSITPYYENATIMIVTNPVDILTYLCSQWMGLPNGRVFGTGNVLDTSRLIRKLADYANIGTEAIYGNIVGEHGDGQVPIWSHLSIASVPIIEYCENVGLEWSAQVRDMLIHDVRNLGAKIIQDKGITQFGIATCVCYLADGVLNDRKIIAPVSSPMEGEYDVNGVSLSVPSIVGIDGVERRLQERWTSDELEAFQATANKLRSFIADAL